MVEKRNELQTRLDERYAMDESIWQEIKDEVAQLKVRIQNEEELTPNDVANVKQLVGKVNATAKEYNQALSQAYKSYKRRLDEQLEQIGYPIIENYIAQKRKEQKDEVSQRLNEKIDTFHHLVQEALDETTLLKQTTIANTIAGQMMRLFPKLASGARNKEISDWQPIQHVVHECITYAESQMQKVYVILPPQSHVANTFRQFFATGDRSVFDNLTDDLQADRPLIEEYLLAKEMKSEADVVRLIHEATKEGNPNALEQVHRLLYIWKLYHS